MYTYVPFAPQDLGIMTTSTLHWVKGAKRVTTGKVAQAMTEIDLVSLPPAARKGLSSSPVPSDDGKLFLRSYTTL